MAGVVMEGVGTGGCGGAELAPVSMGMQANRQDPDGTLPCRPGGGVSYHRSCRWWRSWC